MLSATDTLHRSPWMWPILWATLLAFLIGPLCAHADSASGPDRSTLIPQRWGTVYALPLAPGTSVEENFFGEFIIKTERSRITSVRREGYDKGIWVTYPDEKELHVKVEDDDILVQWHDKWYRFAFLEDGFDVQLPDDTIVLRKKGNGVTIRGQRGEVFIEQGQESLYVKSSAGESRYSRNAQGAYELVGVALSEHPYVRRGVHFETQNVGVFVKFRLEEWVRGLGMLNWYPPMVYR